MYNGYNVDNKPMFSTFLFMFIALWHILSNMNSNNVKVLKIYNVDIV